MKVAEKRAGFIAPIGASLLLGSVLAAGLMACSEEASPPSEALRLAEGASVAAPGDPPPPPSLKTVPVPKPSNLTDYVRDEAAAVALGKALFWDMQIGSDGVTACATCHFHAGADNRNKNQINPGVLVMNENWQPSPDKAVSVGGYNYALTANDFPLHKLSDPNDRNSTVLRDSNDVVSSQGVFNTTLVSVVPGQAEENVTVTPDEDGFRVGGTNVRRVEPRNTPTVINAVFYNRQFWDGRGQAEFNGVNWLGDRDPHAKLFRATNPAQFEEVRVRLTNSSLASQALAPPLSSFEMSADGRTFQEIGDKAASSKRRPTSMGSARKLPRKLAKKILSMRALAKQIVSKDDSVLGSLSRSPQPGLTQSYTALIERAFKPEWWRGNRIIHIRPDGSREVLVRPVGDGEDYSLMEFNFSLFFGLAIQMYEATLVSDDTPFDRFREGDANALTNEQKLGLELFLSQTRGRCINCHGGPEFTDASVTRTSVNRLRRRESTDIMDFGFNNIGVRPTREDIGLGGSDEFGRPLSEARLAFQGLFSDPTLPLRASDVLAVDGAFKVPQLRNVEFTAPFMHNGGLLTLKQVIEFYSRGGDFQPIVSQTGTIKPLNTLNLSEEHQNALVAFLRALTDERVRFERAPFDHPQLFVPNGHQGDQIRVVDDGSGRAVDVMVEIPAVGRNGGAAIRSFLE
jgi:cytochrome c peroxidase